ncbi:hypothetical protein NA78x_004340 [Anatilimnocola sp. NA78]|uniref:hypothetical protein n=1 Tax=Anatilimnocola sp. NA78 TaxID=3415683 RepID=UPI003CE46AD9
MRTFSLLLLMMVVVAVTGCNPKGVNPVRGKISFAGGQRPAAEIAVIRFEPVHDPNAAEGTFKAASGDIQPDGTYRLTTFDPNDGALAGEYKVVFTVLKTYMGRESLVDKKFTTAATTPFTASVKSGSNSFDFDLAAPPSN